MPGKNNVYCIDCGKMFPLGQLSTRGLCRGCAAARMQTARDQITSKSGPIYDQYSKHMTAGIKRRQEAK